MTTERTLTCPNCGEHEGNKHYGCRWNADNVTVTAETATPPIQRRTTTERITHHASGDHCPDCFNAGYDAAANLPLHAQAPAMLDALKAAIETLGAETVLHRTHCSCGSHGRVTPVLDAARTLIQSIEAGE